MVPKIFLRLGHRPRCTDDSTCLWQNRQADGWSANLLLVPILLCVMCLKWRCGRFGDEAMSMTVSFGAEAEGAARASAGGCSMRT
eukprot:scaffold10233_cov128-Isochrysis_galbana.AAC.1